MFIDFRSILSALSRSQPTLLSTKQLHAVITRTHLSGDPFYATRVVQAYALSNHLVYARRVFDETPQRSVFLWNSIIRAYARANDFDEAFSMFGQMLRSEIRPDNFTYACLMRACCDEADLDGLKIVHGGAVVSGLGWDSICGSALVTAYSRLGHVDEASRVFYAMSESHQDLVMWNSMISGYGHLCAWDKGLKLFSEMRSLGRLPDGYTLVGLISGLADMSFIVVGQSIHGLCMKSCLDSDAYVGAALVSMYARCRCMDSACKVFGGLSQPDLVAWSALVMGYCQCGDGEKALLIFRKLTIECRMVDHVLISSVLVAIAQLANVRPGKEIHGFVLRCGLESNIMVSSALIDMYSKCGFLDEGMHIFEHMADRNIITYNSIILGLGLHGLASQAFQLFEEILSIGVNPDHCTFSALLCACCHAGLIEDGKKIFRRMEDEFCLQPGTEHYVYMVKLLGTAGELEEAFDFIQSLPQPVDPGVWGALLSCCEMCGNSTMAGIVAQQLFQMEPEKGAYRVMLSKTYASDGRWSDVKKLRDEIIDGRLKKIPGLSWIGCSGNQIDNKMSTS